MLIGKLNSFQKKIDVIKVKSIFKTKNLLQNYISTRFFMLIFT